MGLGIDLVNGLQDFSIFVDHIGNARGVFVFHTLHSMIRQSDLAIDIAKQLKGKRKFFRKGFIIRDVIQADA